MKTQGQQMNNKDHWLVGCSWLLYNDWLQGITTQDLSYLLNYAIVISK